MESKQPSSFLYIVLGAVTIGASLIIIYILFASGIFKVTFSSDAALLLVGVIYGISLFSIITLLYKWHEGPERARAGQSHLMLTIANETLSHLRRGFTVDTCEKVARIIYETSDVDAVAITNNRTILAFAGSGSEHHLPGTPLGQRREKTEETDGLVIYKSSSDANCPDDGEISWTGISVPLMIQGKKMGAMDFLYLAPKKLTERRITVARGLGGQLRQK